MQLFLAFIADSSPLFNLIVSLLLLGIIIASNAAILPFFQTVKAVIYYDLRSRREGLGLQLRDREI
jgi:hypothetical protein